MLKILGIAAICVAIHAAMAEPADAKEAGSLLMRLRAIHMHSDTNGTTDAIGGSAEVDPDTVPELDFSYFFTDNIAVELILGTTRHSVRVNNTSIGNVELGKVSMLPPVVTLQYHFWPKQQFSPYLGAGVNYTIFYNEDKSSAISSIEYKDSFGWALQAGLDIALPDPWYFNIDVKKVFLSTDIKVNGGAINARNVDLDPWVFGIGVGYRF